MSVAISLLRGLVATDRNERWGEIAAPFQVADAEAILDISPDTPRLHLITRPRGGSKTSDLAGIALAAMMTQLPAGARCYAAAADREQAGLLLDAAALFVQRTSHLRGAVRIGADRIVAGQDVSLQTLAADGPTAYGLRPHLMIIDEIAQWPSTRGAKNFWAALISAMAKVPGSRLVAMSSAGDPVHWAAKVRQTALRSTGWRVSETPGPAPWAKAADLAEQRELLTESQYARLHLNKWTAAEDRLTTPEHLAACVTLDGPLEPVHGRRYVIGVDLSVTHDRTVAAVCHSSRSGPGQGGTASPPQHLDRRIVLDRMQVWTPTRSKPVPLHEVKAWLLTAARHYQRAELIFDPYQGVAIMQDLRAENLRVQQFTFSPANIGRAAFTLYDLIRNNAIALPDDSDLLDELANVRLNETSPGVFRIDHDSGRHDDRATALMLAAQHLLLKPSHVVTRHTMQDNRLAYDRVRHDPLKHIHDAALKELARQGDRTALQLIEELEEQRRRRARGWR